MTKPRMSQTARVEPPSSIVLPMAFIAAVQSSFKTFSFKSASEMLMMTPATRPPRMTRPQLMDLMPPPSESDATGFPRGFLGRKHRREAAGESKEEAG